MSPITSATSASAAPTASTANPSELNMEQFMRLLTVQLENQNPLEPMNDRDFFAQMAQLGQVQGMDKLIQSSSLQQAQELMGKTVTAVRPMTSNSDGQASLVSGVVSRMSVKNGTYYLGIQEADGGIVDVTMDSLQNIQPTQTLDSLSTLIGKKVSGVGMDSNGAAVRANGTVTAVAIQNGRAMAQVRNTDNTQVSIAVSDLETMGG